MKHRILLCSALLLISSAFVVAADTPPQALPFAPEIISRLSLDGKPRSLSIRQGTDVWLGYDLERATILKAWRAPAGKPGLIKSGFTTRSTGTTWFEDTSAAAWELRRGASTVPLSVRYLGCSQRKDHIELRWELRHDAGTLQLLERVPLATAPTADRVVRELRVEGLGPSETLLLPSTARQHWKLTVDQNSAASGLGGTQWHRLTLP